MDTTAVSRKLSKEEKNQLIESWKQSGKTKTAFALEYGLSYFTFAGWTRKRKSCKKGFTQISPAIVSSNAISTVFAELQLSTGNKVTFYQPITAEYFRKLIK